MYLFRSEICSRGRDSVAGGQSHSGQQDTGTYHLGSTKFPSSGRKGQATIRHVPWEGNCEAHFLTAGVLQRQAEAGSGTRSGGGGRWEDEYSRTGDTFSVTAVAQPLSLLNLRCTGRCELILPGCSN